MSNGYTRCCGNAPKVSPHHDRRHADGSATSCCFRSHNHARTLSDRSAGGGEIQPRRAAQPSGSPLFAQRLLRRPRSQVQFCRVLGCRLRSSRSRPDRSCAEPCRSCICRPQSSVGSSSIVVCCCRHLSSSVVVNPSSMGRRPSSSVVVRRPHLSSFRRRSFVGCRRSSAVVVEVGRRRPSQRRRRCPLWRAAESSKADGWSNSPGSMEAGSAWSVHTSRAWRRCARAPPVRQGNPRPLHPQPPT